MVKKKMPQGPYVVIALVFATLSIQLVGQIRGVEPLSIAFVQKAAASNLFVALCSVLLVCAWFKVTFEQLRHKLSAAASGIACLATFGVWLYVVQWGARTSSDLLMIYIALIAIHVPLVVVLWGRGGNN